jgi:hypothetical protein
MGKMLESVYLLNNHPLLACRVWQMAKIWHIREEPIVQDWKSLTVYLQIQLFI